MDETTENAMTLGLGVLQWANVELATNNVTLLGELQKANATIEELREKLSKVEEFLASLKGGAQVEDLPANPYANGAHAR